jgi:hypothetical protein
VITEIDCHDRVKQGAMISEIRNGIPTIDAEIATVLNTEGFCTARGQAFSGNTVWLLRQQWQIPAVKTNGKEGNPLRWEDGSYSVEGLAKAVGVSLGTVYKWLHHGRVKGQQVSKAMPWKLLLTQTDITALQVHVKNARRTKRSLMEAS